MHFSRIAAVAALTAAVAAFPLVVHPGTAADLVITSQDTVNGTTHSGGHLTPQANSNLQLSFQNKISGSVNAYVTGLDPNNNVVLLQPDGSWYYPNANGASTPQAVGGNIAIPLGGEGSTTSINLPTYITAGRIWFAEGNLQFFVVSNGSGGTSLVEPSAVNPEDPSADVNWGFVELTNGSTGLYANISYVDFVGLVLGMILSGSQGTQTVPGLPSNAVSSICNDLQTQSNSDGQPWDQLCVTDSNGNQLRVLAPGDYISDDNSAFSGYYSDYVDQVWSHYTSNTLTIDTQAAAGEVSCQVSGSTLQCDGDNRGYAKPSASDIFGCNSGPFAIESGDNDIHYAVVPRLCAAFDRSTFLISGGNVQPGVSSSDYYTTSPTNHYSRVVHSYEIDGLGYAFAYDDVTPDNGPNESGELTDPNPTTLTVCVGGPCSS